MNIEEFQTNFSLFLDESSKFIDSLVKREEFDNLKTLMDEFTKIKSLFIAGAHLASNSEYDLFAKRCKEIRTLILQYRLEGRWKK